MNTTTLDSILRLVARAEGYCGYPGPAGEVQQRATGIVENHRVMVVIRDGRLHHVEIDGTDYTTSIVKTAEAAADYITARVAA